MSSAKNVRFTIASDIPLPPRTTNRGSPLHTALKGLDVGQVLLVSKKDSKRLDGRQSQLKKQFPEREYARRTLPNSSQVGLWRVR